MSRLRPYLLGPPHVELDGEPRHLPRRKAMALLAHLAETGRPHSRDSLVTLLWPEHDQRSARAELSPTLSLLNRLRGPETLVAGRATAALSPEFDDWQSFQARSLLGATLRPDQTAAMESRPTDS